MIISKWSEDDFLTKEQRSKDNCVFFRRWVIADYSQDWESILKDFVKEGYLLQSDANGLLTIWRNELQLERERVKPIENKDPIKGIIGDYFGKLIISGILYIVVYEILQSVNLPSEAMLDLFCFAGAIWGITAYEYNEEGNTVWISGFVVFLIFFIGYWVLNLLRLLF
jgi:hypothetical protein